MNRRGFLASFAAVPIAAALAIDPLARKIFLPPVGGWALNRLDYRYPIGDVRRYGAVCDGVTDDSHALQAAMNDCRIVTAGGIENVLRVKHPVYAGRDVTLRDIGFKVGPDFTIGLAVGREHWAKAAIRADYVDRKRNGHDC